MVPRFKFGAMVSTEEKLVTMMGWGVDPAEELKFSGISNLISEGRMVEPGKREIVMGAGLLKKIDKKVGDKVTFLYNTAFDSLQASTFQVVGKIQSSIELLNDNVFYLPLDQVNSILEMHGEVTELLIVTRDYHKADSELSFIRELFIDKDPSGKYYL
jgi:putative ABC transport system permease protein